MDKVTTLDDKLNEPAQFLVENIDLLPRGRALDIAMGTGRNAIYLARMGFQVRNWVKPGGMVVYETFIVDQARFGRPRNPDHLFRHNELLHTFRDFRVLQYREGVLEGRNAVASIVAQKV